jgi:hypothetical protein
MIRLKTGWVQSNSKVGTSRLLIVPYTSCIKVDLHFFGRRKLAETFGKIDYCCTKQKQGKFGHFSAKVFALSFNLDDLFKKNSDKLFNLLFCQAFFYCFQFLKLFLARKINAKSV